MEFKCKPTSWENVGIEPPAWLQQGGFEPKYKPPAEYFNWIFNKYTACILELQQTVGDFGDGKADADHRHDNATTEEDGFMSKEDKEKLDTLVKEGGGAKDYNDLLNKPNVVRRPIEKTDRTSDYDVLVQNGIVQSKATSLQRPSNDKWAGQSGFVAGDLYSYSQDMQNVIAAGNVQNTASSCSYQNVLSTGYISIYSDGNSPFKIKSCILGGRLNFRMGGKTGQTIQDSLILGDSDKQSAYIMGSVKNSILSIQNTSYDMAESTIVPGTSSLENCFMIGENNRIAENSEARFFLWTGYDNVYTQTDSIRAGCGIIAGYRCQASGGRYIGVGESLIVQGDQAVFGEANKQPVMNEIFTIANGQYNSSSGTIRSNAMRVMRDGNIYGTKAFNATGADYAEMFEWQDGNPNNEDRRGLFVTLDGEEIRLANAEDDFIFGVVSACPSVVGDNYADDWKGKYKRDVFGEKIRDENGSWVLNPDYDSEQDTLYIPRDQRKEWAAVGMMGKLVVCDDGTCQVNGYCFPGKDGVATKSDTGFRVMKRLDKNHIRILV